MDRFVTAYSKATGLKQRIPEHWVGHPVFGHRFELTPPAADAEDGQAPDGPTFYLTRGGQVVRADDLAGDPVGAPDAAWTRAELDAYAHDVFSASTSGLPNKDAVVAAIHAAATDSHMEIDDAGLVVMTTPNPDGTPSSDETPATGDNTEE